MCPTTVSGGIGLLEDKQFIFRRIYWIAHFQPGKRWPVLVILLLFLLGLITLTDAQGEKSGIADVSSAASTIKKVEARPHLGVPKSDSGALTSASSADQLELRIYIVDTGVLSRLVTNSPGAFRPSKETEDFQRRDEPRIWGLRVDSDTFLGDLGIDPNRFETAIVNGVIESSGACARKSHSGAFIIG